jgi:hypothetical protein
MTILLHTGAAESLPSCRGWLGGDGWRWLRSHESPLETTKPFNLFRNIAAVIRFLVYATTATTTTATPSMQREVG